MAEYMCSNMVDIVDLDHSVAYFLKDNQFFYNTTYQMAKKRNGNFMYPYKVNYNGQTKIVFDTAGLTSVKKTIRHMEWQDCLSLISTLIRELIQVKQNRFIQCETVDLSINHIYVDEKKAIQFVCVPILITSTNESKKYFDYLARLSVAELIETAVHANNDAARNIVSDCKVQNTELEDILADIQSGKYAAKVAVSNSSEAEQSVYGGRYVLKSTSPTEYADIEIYKDMIVVGKSKKDADISITGDSSISRRHCSIYVDAAGVYIADLESTNGTYVNGVRLTPGSYFVLNIGDYIAVGRFTYTLYGGMTNENNVGGYGRI